MLPPVVYRTIPTSNHNWTCNIDFLTPLYIVLFLHQTTTRWCAPMRSARCISYYSYIKPQLSFALVIVPSVVYRTIPTSNHNSSTLSPLGGVLYIVLFLHQTTTYASVATTHNCCISYYSYIKPQLMFKCPYDEDSCISYYSYIKPQQVRTYTMLT